MKLKFEFYEGGDRKGGCVLDVFPEEAISDVADRAFLTALGKYQSYELETSKGRLITTSGCPTMLGNPTRWKNIGITKDTDFIVHLYGKPYSLERVVS